MRKILCTMVLGIVVLVTSAQTISIEAESGTLGGDAETIADNSLSGGNYVNLKQGSLSFSFAVEEDGQYNITLIGAALFGDKENGIAIDGNSSNFFLAESESYDAHGLAKFVNLTAGSHSVTISASWGWIAMDYFEIEKANASERFNITSELCTPNAIDQAKGLYQFLLDNYGKKIISGGMTLNDIENSTWLDWIETNTGKEVALVGMDFMHCNREENTWYDDHAPRDDAYNWYNRNGIPTLMWHWRDPSRNTEEFYTDDTNFDITDILDPSSSGYAQMIADIDWAAEEFLWLQEQGVPVLWRPLHEAAGGWFWWGAKGAAPCKELWHVMYDRLVNYHGVKNLIWVWTREPGDDAWYPGDEFVDIVGRDIYDDGNHGSHSIEFNNMNDLYGGTKMLSLSEVGSFPDPDNLIDDGAAWSWFMPWYQGYTTDAVYNPVDLWNKTMNHEYVITLDEMPNLKEYYDPGTSDPITVDINLSEGWNLLSFNLDLESNLIEDVFANIDIAEIKTFDLFYNASFPLFLNTLSKIEIGEGYFVKCNTAGIMSYTGTEPKQYPAISLQSGWNLVGLNAITELPVAEYSDMSGFSVIKDFDTYKNANGDGSLEQLLPGSGYFILLN